MSEQPNMTTNYDLREIRRRTGVIIALQIALFVLLPFAVWALMIALGGSK